MNFIQNINAANGFSITFLGIVIVFACLLTLSLIVELFHNILFFIENKSLFKNKFKKHAKTSFPKEKNFAGSIKQFMFLTENDEEISLPKFLELATTRGLKYFYPVVAQMVDEGYLIQNKNGFFTLDKKKCETLIQDL